MSRCGSESLRRERRYRAAGVESERKNFMKSKNAKTTQASAASLCRSDGEKRKLCMRLHRIEGQIRGIENAVNADAHCIDILRQINSAAGALKGVWLEFLEGHMKHCIANSLKHSDESLVDELIEHLRKAK